MKLVVCFIYKIRNEFHKYRMKWKLISDSFYHMLNSQKRKKNTVLLLILLRKTRQRRGVTYDVIDELRRLSLSNCFPPLCHKLIYHMILHLWSEISLFHKLIYDIAPGSILILLLRSACTSMCRHMYDWNIVNCDVKQTIQLNST